MSPNMRKAQVSGTQPGTIRRFERLSRLCTASVSSRGMKTLTSSAIDNEKTPAPTQNGRHRPCWSSVDRTMRTTWPVTTRPTPIEADR